MIFSTIFCQITRYVVSTTSSIFQYFVNESDTGQNSIVTLLHKFLGFCARVSFCRWTTSKLFLTNVRTIAADQGFLRPSLFFTDL